MNVKFFLLSSITRRSGFLMKLKGCFSGCTSLYTANFSQKRLRVSFISFNPFKNVPQKRPALQLRSPAILSEFRDFQPIRQMSASVLLKSPEIDFASLYQIFKCVSIVNWDNLTTGSLNGIGFARHPIRLPWRI